MVVRLFVADDLRRDLPMEADDRHSAEVAPYEEEVLAVVVLAVALAQRTKIRVRISMLRDL